MLGSLCSTFNKSTLSSLARGQWLGEEFELTRGSVPSFYSAVCESSVRLLCIDRFSFNECMPADCLKQMEKNAFTKLFKMREMLKNENQIRKELEGRDRGSKYLAKTVNHMQNIYPIATLQTQKKISQIYNKKADGNPFKIVTLREGRLESKREAQID